MLSCNQRPSVRIQVGRFPISKLDYIAGGEGGIEAIHEKNRHSPSIRNLATENVEQAVVDFARDDPLLGQKRVSDALRQREIFIFPYGV